MFRREPVSFGTHNRVGQAYGSVTTVALTTMALCLLGCQRKPSGSLLIAFPKSTTELRLVFSEPVDRATAELPGSYTTERGLRIVAASVDPNDPTRVTLRTEPMATWMTAWKAGGYGTASYQESTKVDVVRAAGVRTASGASLAGNESPRFVQGIPSVRTIQETREAAFPFTSHLVRLVATHEYNPDGGTGGNALIDALGFMFLHRPSSDGPFNSIKIVTNKHVPGLTEAVAEVRAGKRSGLHVMWAGGEIQTADGETRLVDTGFMEGSLVDPPLESPPPYPIKTADITRAAGRTLRAKSLQGVIVRFENVTVDSVSSPDKKGLRSFAFHDRSGAEASGLLLSTVTRKIQPRQKFRFLRGIVHQPRAAEYEVIVELDEHLRSAAGVK